jgi:hypothetical protein
MSKEVAGWTYYAPCINLPGIRASPLTQHVKKEQNCASRNIRIYYETCTRRSPLQQAEHLRIVKVFVSIESGPEERLVVVFPDLQEREQAHQVH